MNRNKPMTNYQFKKYLHKHPNIIAVPLTHCVIKLLGIEQPNSREVKE